MTSRRHFLLGLGATALTPLALRALPSTELLEMTATDGAPLKGVGVQLYMLRDAMRTDPEGTLQRIAETELARSSGGAAGDAPHSSSARRSTRMGSAPRRRTSDSTISSPIASRRCWMPPR